MALRAASRDRRSSPNTSLGVAALSVLVQQASKLLGSEYHCSIVELASRDEEGCAIGHLLRLAQAARDAGHMLRDIRSSRRGGDVIGEHTVRFAGPGEYIELHIVQLCTFSARSRAAAWLKGKPPKCTPCTMSWLMPGDRRMIACDGARVCAQSTARQDSNPFSQPCQACRENAPPHDRAEISTFSAAKNPITSHGYSCSCQPL